MPRRCGGRRRFGLTLLSLTLAALASPAASLPGPSPEGPATPALSFSEPTPDRLGVSCKLGVQLPDGSRLAQACGGGAGGAAAPEGAPGAPFLGERLRIQTPRGAAAPAPLRGTAPDAFVVVHRLGDVAAYSGDGSLLWSRPSMSFFDDWGVEPVGVAPIVAHRVMINPFAQTDPLNAQTIQSDRAFAVGDLTGDGVDDVAVGHFALTSLDEQGGTIGSTSAATLLDGRDGSTLWHRLYPGYVMQLLVHGGLLLVGNVTGDPTGSVGQAGTTSRLDAFGFELEDGNIAADQLWSLDTATQWARWLSLEPAGPDRVAAAWSRGTAGSGGRVLLVDAGSGTPVWSKTVTGFPRTIRFDEGRNQVILHEQIASSPPSFSVSGLRASDGSPETTITHANAILLSIEVADVAGAAEAEWMLGEVGQLRANEFYPGTVSVVDASTGATRWSESRGTRASPSSVPQRLAVLATGAGARVVAASVIIDYGKAPVRISTELRSYDGVSGAVSWTRAGDPLHGDDPAYPVLLAAHQLRGRPVVLAATTSLALRGYDAVDGTPWLEAPTLAEPIAVAATDADADGTTDLIVGTEGGGVFALDGTALAQDPPGILWWAATGGPVRAIELGDLDGDGQDEVVAATTNGMEALRMSDGRRRFRVEYPKDYVFSVGLGDVTGDGRADVVVPTRSVAAYRGTDGALLWETPAVRHEATGLYFSNAAITAGGDVAVQAIHHPVWRAASVVDAPTPNGPYLQQQVTMVLDGADGTPVWSASTFDDRPTFMPRWRAVLAGPAVAGGRGPVFTFERQDQIPNLSGAWRPGLYAHGAADGAALWQGRSSAGVVHMGTIPRGDRALEFSWGGLLNAGPTGAWEVPVGVTSDAASADFGPMGGAFLTNFDGSVHVFPAGTPDAAGQTPELLAEHEGLTAGRLLVADLDGDEVDEVVTFGFDWLGFAVVSATSGMLVLRADSTPHGLTVLEARTS